MNLETFSIPGIILKTLRIAALVIVLFAAGQSGYAQGRLEDDVRKENKAKDDIARREAAERARIESAKTMEKLNETKSLNKTESLNKKTEFNKPEIRNEAKLREAADTLKKTGMKEGQGGQKATEAGNPTTSGDGGRGRGRVPTKGK